MQETRQKVTLKLIAFVLSIITLFYAIPAIVYAEAADALKNIDFSSGNISIFADARNLDICLTFHEQIYKLYLRLEVFR